MKTRSNPARPDGLAGCHASASALRILLSAIIVHEWLSPVRAGGRNA